MTRCKVRKCLFHAKIRCSRAFGVLSLRSAFIDIESDEHPIGAKANSVQELLLMERKVVIIFRLIEVADIDGNQKRCFGRGLSCFILLSHV